MREDKALLRFRGKPMVEIAVEKLREFCAEVWIAGNREDLSGYAPVVKEARVNAGPSAGIEAGLVASTQPWAMFVPVDVPLVPAKLLRRWAEAVLRMDGAGLTVSLLAVDGESHPAFCMLQRNCSQNFSEAIDGGERSLRKLLQAVGKCDGSEWVHDAGALRSYTAPEVLRWWFANVNTPQDLQEAETWASGNLGLWNLGL